MVVIDAVDDDACPEARAVLAYAPAFADELALPLCGLKHLLRHAGGAVFFRVELGEMLADDLVGLEALDALGTGVPAGHDAFRVQQVDRIIDD